MRKQGRWGILSLSSPLVPKSERLVGRQRKKEETRRKRFSGLLEHLQNRRTSATAYAREEQVTWSQVM
ncbi:MAG: hypothetical protein DMG56_22165 [Acidobacteria bacterium]|nr:MAG: hypothetical protein DMG54_22760 [Acidobacteriota bacterium]PYU52350.1 MAG: hypothetical protein DMG53_00515 [Acidobacteriota bacterium]PYU57581.1 MAG: hypothetical protein DMG56_22165 [Acidobacteriota bacterium]PYU68558.1 MAG: hypothetical protein DMG52_31165 [Acidobacteriota bacterium]